MNIDKDLSKERSQWTRIIYQVFGYLFIALLLVFIVRLVFGELFYTFAENINPWMVIGWELLTLLIILQQINRVRSQGKKPYTIALSVFLGVFAIFSLFSIESLTRENASLSLQAKQQAEYVTYLSKTVSHLTDIINKLDPTILKPPTVDPTPPLPTSGGGPSSDPSNDLANNFVLYTAAISGLVTAISGFYGQIISARKTKIELEIQKLKLELEQKKEAPQKPKKAALKNQPERVKTKKTRQQSTKE